MNKLSKSYWTNTNLGEVTYRKIQAALAEDKAEQTRYRESSFTETARRAWTRNIKAIDRIIADIDAIIHE